MTTVVINGEIYRLEPTGATPLAFRVYEDGRKTPHDGMRLYRHPGIVNHKSGGIVGYFSELTMLEVPEPVETAA